MMKRLCLLATTGVILLLLAACGNTAQTGPDARNIAIVKLGVSQGAAARDLGTLGVPATESGVSGVTAAVLTVLRDGEAVLFDADGNEDSGGSSQVMLDLVAGSTELSLMYGSYEFRVNAVDDDDNLLATGALSHTVNADVSLQVPLVSEIGSVELLEPLVVQAEQLFDVYLRVSPPGRPDLWVPTSDFVAVYSHYDPDTNDDVTPVASSGQGIRFDLQCVPIELAVEIYRPGAPDEIVAAADLSIGSETICPVVPGGIGVDVEPPQLELDPFPAIATVGFATDLSGTVQDEGSGVESVQVYDGPVLIGEAEVDRTVSPYTWRFSWTPSTERNHNFRFVAQDVAGNQRTRAAPVEVGRRAVFSSVSAGYSHACGLTGTGAAYCWGRGDLGQLGNGQSGHEEWPSMVSGGHVFQQVEAGGVMFSCGLTGDGRVMCWGYNNLGQLGTGTNDNFRVPEPVDVDESVRFTALRVGYAHSCAQSESGDWYCWGQNDFGQLGDETTDDAATPVLLDHSNVYVDLIVGYGFTCGLTSDGKAYCWGEGAFGQLGNGTYNNSLLPVEVTGDHAFSYLSAMWRFICGHTTGGDAYCWGYNPSGLLGDGTAETRLVPTPLTSVPGLVRIYSGWSHICGITGSGNSYCWGSGTDGQLGNGAYVDSLVPVQVSTAAEFTAISSGADFSCGTTASGPVYCWGNGMFGRLGNGLTDNQAMPVPVMVAEPD